MFYILSLLPPSSTNSNGWAKIEAITWEQEMSIVYISEEQGKKEAVLTSRVTLGCEFEELLFWWYWDFLKSSRCEFKAEPISISISLFVVTKGLNEELYKKLLIYTTSRKSGLLRYTIQSPRQNNPGLERPI